MSVHTPGPWKPLQDRLSPHVWEVWKDGKPLAYLPKGHEADARLIAAAPELLEAARFALSLLDDGADIYGSMGRERRELQELIAKAEGK